MKRIARTLSVATLIVAILFPTSAYAMQSDKKVMIGKTTNVAKLTHQGVSRLQTATGKKRVIDISHHQGTINFAQLSAEYAKGVFDGMYVQISQGHTLKDPMAGTYISQARAHGIPVGVYHFSWPNQDSAASEAQNFMEEYNKYKGTGYDFMPMLDVEEPTQLGVMSTADLLKWSDDWANIVKPQVGTEIGVYTGTWFVNSYTGWGEGLSQYPLWVSDYRNVQAPDKTGGWNRWLMWQYTSSGKVAGINGNVDMSWVEDFTALRGVYLPYTLASGDSLNVIANRFHTTIDALMAINHNIQDANLINAGTVIRVPSLISTMKVTTQAVPVSAPAQAPTPVVSQPIMPAQGRYVVRASGLPDASATDKDVAYKWGWADFEAGHKDVVLTTPDGSIYTFAKHLNENPYALNDVPDWAKTAVKAGLDAKAFSSPTGSDEWYRYVQVLYNLGMFDHPATHPAF